MFKYLSQVKQVPFIFLTESTYQSKIILFASIIIILIKLV